MTDREQITLEQIDAKVTKGFSHINDRLAVVEQRYRFLEGDSDVLRHGEEVILAKIESLPCAQHTEDIRAIRRKVSEETRCLRNEHTTGKIELARMEAVHAATKAMRDEAREERKLAQAAAAMRWKRIAIVLAPLTAIAVAVVTAVLKGCIA